MNGYAAGIRKYTERLWIGSAHSLVEDGSLYVSIRFMDKTEFSLQFSAAILTHSIDLSDMSTGNFKMIREYCRMEDE
jgi:hypothetical protein